MTKVMRTLNFIEKVKSGADLTVEDLSDFTIAELETLCLSFGPNERFRILRAMEGTFIFSSYLDFVADPPDPSWNCWESINEARNARCRRALGVPDAEVEDSGWQASLDECFANLRANRNPLRCIVDGFPHRDAEGEASCEICK
jgi:phosphatidylserine/phosphatidylglycerophosphate/cardiolipin synthase-like enzyme